jgi:hypothetical protein
MRLFWPGQNFQFFKFATALKEGFWVELKFLSVKFGKFHKKGDSVDFTRERNVDKKSEKGYYS